jgi:two-component system chemotaxis response regulator CheY
MVSTEAEMLDRAEARASGANFYLVKPVAEAELVRHVCVLTGVRL